jgi:O-antigen/teichoic acid export membrane protein
MQVRWPERNTWASFGGVFGAAFIFFTALAWYVRLLNAFEFSCVGLFLTLSAITLAFDGGAGQSVNRELASNSATAKGQALLQACFAQLLNYCLLITAFLALMLFLLLPWVASYWLKIDAQQLVMLREMSPWIALTCALQVPLAFYTQAMQGLSLHILCNSMNVSFLALRFWGAGGLMNVLPDDRLASFFMWHLTLSLLHIYAIHFSLQSKLANSQEQVSDPDLWPRIKPFMRDMAALSVVTTVITQIDKVVVSRLVSFDQYGYYVMIASLASVLVRVAQPLFAVVYPRMTQAVARGDLGQLKGIYAFSLANPLISWYSQKPELVQLFELPMQLLAVGYAANAIMHIPFALTLAHGWARFALVQNIIAVIVLVPILWIGTYLWGIQGAALGWSIVNLAYLLISTPIIKRHCLSIPRKPIRFPFAHT